MTLNIRQGSKGFTIIELMIVIMVIGIIAAIAIPNYIKFAKRAKEAVVLDNAHTVQLAMEDFCIDQLGTYPTATEEAELLLLLPQGRYPENPFTNAETAVHWNADPAQPGEISIFNLPGGGYMLRPRGAETLLNDVVVGD